MRMTNVPDNAIRLIFRINLNLDNKDRYVPKNNIRGSLKIFIIGVITHRSPSVFYTQLNQSETNFKGKFDFVKLRAMAGNEDPPEREVKVNQRHKITRQ